MKKLIDLVFRMNYTLRQGSLDSDISAVVYDSRKAEPGCIFVCMPGAVTDGHKYIPAATKATKIPINRKCSQENIPGICSCV